MFFSVDRETLRWIQKTLSRARCSGNWPALFAREACWTPQIFEALVDEHDRLVLEGQTTLAEEIGSELPRLAERIRAALCPFPGVRQNLADGLGSRGSRFKPARRRTPRIRRSSIRPRPRRKRRRASSVGPWPSSSAVTPCSSFSTKIAAPSIISSGPSSFLRSSRISWPNA